MVTPIESKSSILNSFDLENQIWREIDLLTDFRLLKDNLKSSAKKFDIKLSDDYAEQKTKDIKYCIRQAREYFASSKSASLVIKPTLIYYGIISLAAALIIIRKQDKSLNSMRAAHGLRDKYPSELLSPKLTFLSRENVLKISVVLSDSGTFSEIAELEMSERFSMIMKEPGKNEASKDFKQTMIFKKQYPKILEIDLQILLQNIPEVWKEVKLLLKNESFTYKGDAIISSEFVTCRILKELSSVKELRNNFSFIRFSDLGESNDYFFFKLPYRIYESNTPLIKRAVDGSQFLVADNNNSLITTDFINYYLTFFILGSLARYKPALWREILENNLNGLSTIPEILCNASFVKMPLSFLCEINDNFYKL